MPHRQHWLTQAIDTARPASRARWQMIGVLATGISAPLFRIVYAAEIALPVICIVKRAPLRRLSNRQPAESLTELLHRLAFDKQQNGLLGHVGLSHPFVNCVNRLCISQTGNDWSE